MEEIIAIKISPEKKAKIAKQAFEKGLPLASYCRMILIEKLKEGSE